MIRIHDLSFNAGMLAKQELKMILQQNGREYEWEYEDDAPIVVVNFGSGAIDAYIHKVWLDENDQILVCAKETEGWYEETVELDDVDSGHIEYIVGYMTDVTVQESPYFDAVNVLIDQFVDDLGKINAELL